MSTNGMTNIDPGGAPSYRKPMKVIKRSEMTAHYNMLDAIDGMARAFAWLSAGEIGECVLGRISGRISPDEITIFKKCPCYGVLFSHLTRCCIFFLNEDGRGTYSCGKELQQTR